LGSYGREKEQVMVGRLLVVIVLSFLFRGFVLAQVDTGSIEGSVVDPTGGFVASAAVKLVDTRTGQVVATRANGEGFFALPNLKPSRYSLSATAPGFQTVTRTGITVRLQDRISVDFRLEVGESTTVITVDAPPPPLESETSSVGAVVGEREIQALPLNGRNYLQLATLGGGTSPSQRTQERNTFVANGARPIQNSYLLDGIDNKNKIMGFDAATAQSVEPVIDAISEFKVHTSNFSAEFGQSAGAVVNATIKSGTNNLHGSLFEFLRNSYFDAQPYFQPPGGAAPALIQNQFGATLGGPVIKNRTFFFSAWQSSREVNAAPQLATVPSAANISGQFARPIFDPASTRPNPGGPGFVRDPFPNQAVPVARFDPVAAKLALLYPAPNRPGSINYFSNQKESLSADQYIARIDHQIGPRDTVFARYIYSTGTGILPGTLPPPANDISVNDTGVHSAAVSDTHLFNSHLINEARVGVQQSVESQQSNGPRLFAQYGIKGAPEIEDVRGLPVFTFSGLTSLGTVGPGNLPTPSTGSGNLPLDKLGRTIQMAENLTFVHGRQTMKFGFDYQQVTLYADATVYARPAFLFTGAQTQNPLQTSSVSGAPFADFLLGQATQAAVSTRSIAEIRQNIFQGYWQNDWKVLPRLTVNAGLRYELPMPFYETSDQYANIILEPGPLFAKLLDAHDVAGTGYRRSFSDPNWKNFAPRIGFAWRLNSRTVIRSAFGVFFGRDENMGIGRRPTNNPPYVALNTYGPDSVHAPIVLATGFPEGALDPGKLTAPAVVSFLRHAPTPYVQQWNFNLQRELPGGFVLQLAYIGSSAHALYSPNQINTPPPGPGAIQSRRPFPQFGTLTWYVPLVSSNYSSFQATAERRFARGFGLLAAYTWSHSIDNGSSNADRDDLAPQNPADYHAERGSSNFDIRHRLSVSSVWQLPFGKAHRFLRTGSAAAVAGGWQFSGILSAQTGLPFTPRLPIDTANTGTPTHPNRIGSGVAANPTVQSWFDQSAFVLPPKYTWGNSGRNIGRGPGFRNVDLGLSRLFRLRERVWLEFRAEAFNLFNTPQLGSPIPTLFVPTTGAIFTVTNPQRELQLALRLRF
jgi:hypothetical protein